MARTRPVFAFCSSISRWSSSCAGLSVNGARLPTFGRILRYCAKYSRSPLTLVAWSPAACRSSIQVIGCCRPLSCPAELRASCCCHVITRSPTSECGCEKFAGNAGVRADALDISIEQLVRLAIEVGSLLDDLVHPLDRILG